MPVRCNSYRWSWVVVGCAGIMLACVRDTEPVTNRGLTQLSLSDSVGVADGAQVVLVSASIDTTARASNSSVTFTTTSGSFSTGGSKVDALANDSGYARVELVAPKDSGLAIVTATAGGLTLSRAVRFGPAPPDWISLSAPYSVPAALGKETDVTAAVFRNRGAVSSGTVVHFSLTVLQGSASIGRLTVDSALVSQGTATTKFVVTDTVPGSVRIDATTLRGRTVRASSVILVVKGGS